MTARRLQHVSVQVPGGRLEETAAFYGEVLGMRRVPNPAGRAWFEFGDGDQVHLLEGPGAAESTGHLALQVDDLPATLERARGRGGRPERGRVLWGAERWFVRDPAGNLVELFEVPPAPATDGPRDEAPVTVGADEAEARAAAARVAATRAPAAPPAPA